MSDVKVFYPYLKQVDDAYIKTEFLKDVFYDFQKFFNKILWVGYPLSCSTLTLHVLCARISFSSFLVHYTRDLPNYTAVLYLPPVSRALAIPAQWFTHPSPHVPRAAVQ